MLHAAPAPTTSPTPQAPALGSATHAAAATAHQSAARAHKRAQAEAYLNILEQEYLTADVRRRIFPAPDRGPQRRVATLKKERILLIAERDSLASIFSDPARMAERRQQLGLDGAGLPLFYYKDHVDRGRFEARDVAGYFAPDNTVEDAAGQRGRITTVDGTTVRVLFRGHLQATACHMATLRRIF